MIHRAFNRVAALLVLGAVVVWVGLGEFGSSGSRPTPARAAETVAAPTKKVGVIVVAAA